MLALLFLPLSAAAQQFTSGADFLMIGSGARSEGMGGAFTAVADDVNALTFNPAGLATLKVPEIGYLRMIYVGDLAYNFGGVAVPLSAGENSLGLGVGIVNLGVPAFDSTLGIASPISASDNAILLSVAYRIQDMVSFGLTGKYLFRNITGYNAAALAGDFGILATPSERLRLGAGVFNVGQSIKFNSAADSLPTLVKLGLSYEFVRVQQHSALISLEGAYLFPAQAGLGAAGAEYWYDQTLAARVGFAGDAYQQHWTAGVGLRLQMFQFDYSYSPVGTLGDSHRLSILLRLGAEGIPGLSAPSGFAAEAFDGGVLLKWKPSASKDVVGYNLYVKKPEAVDYTRLTGHPLNDTSVKLKSLLNGKSYAFALTSVSAAGRESNRVQLSTVAGGKAVAAPASTPGLAAPTGLKAEARGEGLRLSWVKAEPDVTGYNLYLTADPEKPARKLSENPIPGNQVDLKKVNPERLYRFSLTSVNKQGAESAPSAVLEVKPAELMKSAVAPVTKPVPVLTVEPTPTVTTKPAAPSVAEKPTVVKVETPVPEKAETTAPNGSTHSVNSGQAALTTSDTKWITEGKVKVFTIRPGDGMVRLSWGAVPGAVGYNLYVSSDEKTFTLLTKNGPLNILELNIRSLQNGKTYYFVVSAVNETGQESEKTMLPVVPAAP